jgi:hypothetical protein
VAGLLAMLGGPLLAGCDTAVAPLPRPLPPNIEIASAPAYGDTIDPGASATLAIEFSRPMDPYSLLLLRRVAFLLPISADRLEGYWNLERTRVEFRLTEFPIQPGATYEAVFAGLRSADGELYNKSPFEVLYYVRGTPDLLPMHPHPRLESRDFCRWLGKGSGACDAEVVMQSTSFGVDSLRIETRCGDCTNPERRDFFRQRGSEIQWLGFDAYAGTGELLRSVRWLQPPTLFRVPPQPGATHELPPQTAPDGTALQQWKARLIGTDSPREVMGASVLPIQLSFTDSWVLEIESSLAIPGSPTEHRLERWWLYPGVGLVQRETRLQLAGETTTRLVVEHYTPSLSLLSTP